MSLQVVSARMAGSIEMKPRLRLGALVACFLAALAIPSLAGAVMFIEGSARGHTIALGDGTYLIVGTYRDATGEVGTYSGRYTEQTTGYTSCRSTGIGSIHCGEPGFPFRCNLVTGEVTLRSRGKSVTLHIGAAGLGSPAARIQSGVCLQDDSSENRDMFLMLTNRTQVWPATEEEFSRGYGIIAYAEGSLVGSSRPLGGSVLADEFDLDLGLFGNAPA
jgi:hypothetical protein